MNIQPGANFIQPLVYPSLDTIQRFTGIIGGDDDPETPGIQRERHEPLLRVAGDIPEDLLPQFPQVVPSASEAAR